MPSGVGGEEAMKGLLQMDPNAKLIASSGFSDDPAMLSFRSLGFKGCLPKPYDALKLSLVLNETLMGE